MLKAYKSKKRKKVIQMTELAFSRLSKSDQNDLSPTTMPKRPEVLKTDEDKETSNADLEKRETEASEKLAEAKKIKTDAEALMKEAEALKAKLSAEAKKGSK